MQKTKLAIATSTVVGLSALAYQGAIAGEDSTNATADLVQDISVVGSQPMLFGNLLNDLTAGSETVSFNTAGTALAGGTDVRLVDGTPQPAKFTLSTDSYAASDQSISVAAAALDLTGAGSPTATLPWRSLHADFNAQGADATQTANPDMNITVTGASVPTAGATLDVYGGIEVQEGDPTGTYIGTITVTANRT